MDNVGDVSWDVSYTSMLPWLHDLTPLPPTSLRRIASIIPDLHTRIEEHLAYCSSPVPSPDAPPGHETFDDDPNSMQIAADRPEPVAPLSQVESAFVVNDPGVRVICSWAFVKLTPFSLFSAIDVPKANRTVSGKRRPLPCRVA